MSKIIRRYDFLIKYNPLDEDGSINYKKIEYYNDYIEIGEDVSGAMIQFLKSITIKGQVISITDVSKLDTFLRRDGTRKYKVIFLDVDGVINNANTKELSSEGYIGIDDNLVKRVKEIVDKTGAKIVLSSSWREAYLNEKPDGLYLKNKLEKQGLSIIDITENGDKKQDRGEQISRYLDLHDNITHYVILDDEFVEFFIRFNLYNNLVSTDYAVGLTDKDVNSAIEILNNSDYLELKSMSKEEIEAKLKILGYNKCENDEYRKQEGEYIKIITISKQKLFPETDVIHNGKYIGHFRMTCEEKKLVDKLHKLLRDEEKGNL